MTGYFGKLASQGDFVARGLPSDFIDAWDAWLQAGMLESRTRLGGRWLGLYLNAPVWRFVLDPAVCGAAAVAGVVMPSVDRVGRYFPLTVAAAVSTPSHGAAPQSAWFDALEEVGVRAMCGALSLAAFEQALAGLPQAPEHTVMPERRAVFWTDGAPRVTPSHFVTCGLPPAATFGAMLGA